MDSENMSSSYGSKTYMYATFGLAIALVIVLVWWWYSDYYSMGLKLWGILPADKTTSSSVATARKKVQDDWANAKD